MHVIGTAGHVDHGKSTLVQALTGIDPDRLKEEKAREMTIDLGFAWLNLPGTGQDVEPIGIIDVPGHRDFIENMLAGVGGIDAVLFVVAADEGVMPQTREHLAIVDLLRIPAGIVVLTKIDMVSDREWLELVQLDLAEVMAGTVLENAPVIPVSARTGEKLDLLRDRIRVMIQDQIAVPDLGKPRLWVDRVFSVSGFGTVVTGTLLDGPLKLGQEIEFQPGGQRGRIRGLQSHHHTLEVVKPGNRVAVNVSGIDRDGVRRGYLLTLPGLVTPTRLVAVHFRHLHDAPRPLKHNAEVKIFCGAAETVARVRLLESDSLPPGAEGWLQLELRDPLPLLRGDRFILRYPSPGETIGGGDIIDPAPGRRWRRNRPEVIARLEALAAADPDKLIRQALTLPMSAAQLADETGLDESLIQTTLKKGGESFVALRGDLWIAAEALTALCDRLTRTLADFHKAEALHPGIRPERLRSALNLGTPEFEALVEIALARSLVSRAHNGTLAQHGYTIHWTKTQHAAIDRLMAAFEEMPYTPPSFKDSAAVVGEEVLTALIELGELRQVSPEVLFRPAAFAALTDAIHHSLADTGRISVKTLRDQFTTSRKYALALLEYLDNLGITRRDGDDHVSGSGDWGRLN
jgi:selenocysteine-specific elongation factor